MVPQSDLLHYETQAKNKGLRFIFGVDEAGRGPLAGPVVAAAVCLRQSDFKNPINDSKKMTAKAREKAFHEIFEKAYVGIGIMSEKTIDIVNILNASHLAMDMAVKELIHGMPKETVSHDAFCGQVMLLIDGNIFRTRLPYQYQVIIGGDGKSLSIACASIIAKVYRDRILGVYDKIFPQYGFAKHKGYPTKDHQLAVKKHGSSIIHRKTFRGVL
ncbi:MAG: ribonuclease HII [Candidatus Omnitrophica bacterium]|nr:ribonuclease HII [Candidatus Omnitrophota bacterium]